jgi:HSP20 family protein
MFNLTRRKNAGQPLANPRHSVPSRWEPFHQIRDEMDRLFDQFFRGAWPALQQDRSHWDLDVQDKGDEVVVTTAAPGFEPGDFDVHMEGNELVVRAERRSEEKGGNGRHEWRQSQLYRAVTLPAGCDAEKAKASYKNGVLAISLPKTEKSKAKRILIKG